MPTPRFLYHVVEASDGLFTLDPRLPPPINHPLACPCPTKLIVKLPDPHTPDNLKLTFCTACQRVFEYNP